VNGTDPLGLVEGELQPAGGDGDLPEWAGRG
jgi:hypothetical protein